MSRGGARVWGNAHPAAQLTERKVIRYRELVRSGKATVGELAAREGCSHGRISMAVRGETWAHLNDVAPPVPATPRRPVRKAAPAKTGAKTGRAGQRVAAKQTGRAKPAATRSIAKRAAVKQVVAKRGVAKKAAPAKRPARKAVGKAAARRSAR